MRYKDSHVKTVYAEDEKADPDQKCHEHLSLLSPRLSLEDN